MAIKRKFVAVQGVLTVKSVDTFCVVFSPNIHSFKKKLLAFSFANFEMTSGSTLSTGKANISLTTLTKKSYSSILKKSNRTSK